MALYNPHQDHQIFQLMGIGLLFERLWLHNLIFNLKIFTAHRNRDHFLLLQDLLQTLIEDILVQVYTIKMEILFKIWDLVEDQWQILFLLLHLLGFWVVHKVGEEWEVTFLHKMVWFLHHHRLVLFHLNLQDQTWTVSITKLLFWIYLMEPFLNLYYVYWVFIPQYFFPLSLYLIFLQPSN